MRKLCPNHDRDDSQLDTVLEVPIPDEMLANAPGADKRRGGGPNMRAWLKTQAFDRATAEGPAAAAANAELQLFLNVVGSPLIPCPVPHDRAFSRSIRDSSIQASTAKYIMQQYIAATGGQAALQGVQSMYAVGKVKMCASEFHLGDQTVTAAQGRAEVGGFVLWQKCPEVWYFELIMAGHKMSAGSDGKVAWRQSAAENSHASRGPPRPLRRSLQGLDPRSIANLFSDAVCIGEKVINGEECFILKLEASAMTLRARSAAAFDIIHHTVWGYFSQRTGLLIQLEDNHLLRMKSGKGARRSENIFWETSMESVINNYRHIDGVNIAHGGKTTVTLFRYGEGSVNHKRKLEETWTVEEADFNVKGLTSDYFLPPSDLKKEGDDQPGG
ncbi:hypothetical protein CFC21_042300 [Triticum aestivum]|uniref:DUF620 domain-containing protein n=3 Tax=Triticum TaxID=4564 RepID=A0A077RVE3_WHEAT|nr:uncharacterized protein LOC119281544 [Triticum dicoccoides]XP_044350185.1 uncharacterized protein LOC123070871 [Triticum aestivum]VAH80026.1 unnamed protein product [Triticum turgidum subsp. durum]KAF7030853.1 hypothetical protein CFC21_042300 [Triticum aestivum]CDM82436.1 unnamed protein product [Triticum aestivum]CDM84261.1 unnamed protein product [Triticum aestivum]